MKKFLFMAAMLMAWGSSARAEFPSFTIIDTNNVEHTFTAKGLKMSCAGGVLKVTSSELTSEFEISSLQKMFFSSSTGLDGINEENTAAVTLYNLDGSKAGHFSSEAAVREMLSPGVYVIEAQGKTRKIVIK